LSKSFIGATGPGFSGGYEWTLWAPEQLRLVHSMSMLCLNNECQDIILFYGVLFIETMQQLISASVFSDGQCLTQDSLSPGNKVRFCSAEQICTVKWYN